MTDPLREIEHRMATARPWDLAEDGSIWEITGQSPDGKHTFDQVLAMAVVEPHASGEEPDRAFGFIPDGQFIPPSLIRSARPLLLVWRDDPTQPYEERDRVWLIGGDS